MLAMIRVAAVATVAIAFPPADSAGYDLASAACSDTDDRGAFPAGFGIRAPRTFVASVPVLHCTGKNHSCSDRSTRRVQSHD